MNKRRAVLLFASLWVAFQALPAVAQAMQSGRFQLHALTEGQRADRALVVHRSPGQSVWMTTTCAWILASTGPAPKRSVRAASQAEVASASVAPERASISPRNGVPWQ